MTTTTDGLNKAAELVNQAREALRDASIDARPVVFAGIAAVQDMLGFQESMIDNIIEISDEGDADDSWIADYQAEARLQRDDPEAYAAKEKAAYDAELQAFFAQFGGGDDGIEGLSVDFVAPDAAVSVTHLDGVGTLRLEPNIVQGPDSVSD